MKKIILLILCIFNLLTLQAQVVKTIDISTPGSLSTSISAEEKNTITSLTITGIIDAREFKTMRDEMPLLEEIDLEDAQIAAYTGSEGTTIYTETYPENHIPQYAYYESQLTSFIVPSTATFIGESAFFDCKQLSSVNIPSGIDSIGRSAFSYCHGLISLNISEGVTHIGESAFNECMNLGSVSIPASMRIIDKNAFVSCFNLSSLTISDGVIIIGESAFGYCKALSTVVLPSSVTSINKLTFSGCNNLTSVVIPSSVTSIGSQAFAGCEKLSTVTLPVSVTSIGEGAFSNCGITSFTIPASVKSIEKETFSHCEYLSSVEISQGVTSIGESAFFWCSKLGSVILPSSVVSIGDYAFNYCSNLSSVVIPEGVTSIGRSAFIYCIRIKSISIPSSITSIGMNAFYNCSGLVSIKAGFSIPLDLVYSQNAFYLADKATCKLQVPYGTKGLYAAAYQWKDFANIIESPIVFNLSDNRVTIAAGEGSNASVEITSDMAWTAESSQPWLTVNPTSGNGNGILVLTATANPSAASRTAHITVSLNGVAAQTVSLLQEAKGITMQVIPGALSSILTDDEKSTVTRLILTGTIDARDFKTMRDELPNLEIVDLSDVHIVAYTGTEGTDVINTISYPENGIPQYAFYNRFTSIGKASLNSFIYPVSATSIGVSAFSNCNNLNSAILPSSMESIANESYMNCWQLSSVTIPVGVEKIGASAFQYCTSLASVTIPTSVNSMGNSSFTGCSNLNALIISEGVQSIGEFAFSQCTSLTSVIIPSSVSSIGTGSFINCGALSSAIISHGVTSIGESAFVSCIGLTSITIPSSVRTIGDEAFANCKKISTVIISEGVTTIGKNTFYNCTSLNSVMIPSSVTSMGQSAFSSCASLVSINAGFSNPLDLSLSPLIFNGVNRDNCILYVPYGTKTLYERAPVWNTFHTIIENTVGFHLSSNFVRFADTVESNALIKINGNITWTARSNQTWLTVNPLSGNAIDTLEINASDNPATTERLAIVTVSGLSGSDTITQTIVVSQESKPKMIEVTPGGLSAMLTEVEKSTITKLKLSGTIDARDFRSLRDDFFNLAKIDLADVHIATYIGQDGTIYGLTTYPENEIPQYAFSSYNGGKTTLTRQQLFIC